MARFSRSDFTLESFRRQLANVDALPQLCVLGLVSGVITGAVMVAFRLLLEAGAVLYMPEGEPEAFEGLMPWLRALLPIVAVTLIGLLLYRQRSAARKLGVSHVIERLTYHQGRFPLRNWLNQWWVGVVSVLGGLSAGREGPAIHLGAAASSGLGLKLRLPNNSLRVLVACGTAAGISASFNTPIAGVIFAMEVVMMEYTIAGFTPIILAAVSAAIVTQAVYGTEPAFSVPALTMNSLLEIPWILAIAVIIGIAAAGFIQLVDSMGRYHHRPVLLRIAVAGLLMV
ncbi:MAG: chloride channel protein, partial [Pseudomonadota bacterium]|nr:chloride channel protein [Pseudomonadota bacterium]